jgi:hypothetical protein
VARSQVQFRQDGEFTIDLRGGRYVHHIVFAIEQGAVFAGRSRRAGNDADLNAVIEAKEGQLESA